MSGPDLLIAVTSSPDNFEKREVIRKSWARSPLATSGQVGVIFILGQKINSVLLDREDLKAYYYQIKRILLQLHNSHLKYAERKLPKWGSAASVLFGFLQKFGHQDTGDSEMVPSQLSSRTIPPQDR